jgi:hypothetical protein
MGARGLVKGFAKLLLSSCYKSEGKHIVLNTFNTLQNLFIWNNSITSIFDSKLYMRLYACIYNGESAILWLKRLS